MPEEVKKSTTLLPIEVRVPGSMALPHLATTSTRTASQGSEGKERFRELYCRGQPALQKTGVFTDTNTLHLSLNCCIGYDNGRVKYPTYINVMGRTSCRSPSFVCSADCCCSSDICNQFAGPVIVTDATSYVSSSGEGGSTFILILMRQCYTSFTGTVRV